MEYTRLRAGGPARDLILARLGTGDEVVGSLKSLAKREDLPAAAVTGLGAVSDVTLAFYDRVGRSYIETRLAEELEVTSMTGNIAWLGDEPAVHLHGVVSRRDASAAAGHIMRVVVSVTIEVMLVVYPERIFRKNDPATGLNLLDLR